MRSARFGRWYARMQEAKALEFLGPVRHVSCGDCCSCALEKQQIWLWPPAVATTTAGIDGGETELGRTFGGVHCGSSRLKGQRPCHGNATELVSKGAWAWGCPGIASLFELRVSGSGLNMQGLGFNIKIHCFAISVQGYKWVCRTGGGNLQPSSSSPGFEKHEFLKQRWDLVQHEAR